jgi:putative protease
VPDIELEAFVHGSMCISYSGRCLMSNYMTGRSANLGDCAQPCRWNYRVYSNTPSSSRAVRRIQDPNLDSSVEPLNDERFYLEENQRPGEYFPIEETENGTNIMSSKDLALVEFLPEILKAGVVGLKVEGRNKSEYYLATVGYTYKKALDLIAIDKYDAKAKKGLRTELDKVNNRQYTTGFILGDAKNGETYEGRSPIRDWDYVGQVLSSVIPSVAEESLSSTPKGSLQKGRDDNGECYKIIVKNKLSVHDKVEILTPGKLYQDEVLAIKDIDGHELIEINPGKTNQNAIVTLKNTYSENSFIRKELYE